MNEQLLGIHHVTAITSDAQNIYKFYTNILGMRLVKKNVNQDDLTSFHLFFADDRGNAGTDMTFFDFKGIGKRRVGTNDISRTSFRVPSDAALEYWLQRFAHYEVKHEPIREHFGRKFIYFEDFDQQRYALVSDENIEGVASGEPWKIGPVPDEFAITGLGSTFLTVSNEHHLDQVLTRFMNMRQVAKEEGMILYEMGEGGNGASLIIQIDKVSPQAMQGFGGVHHVAFRVKDKETLEKWIESFDTLNLPNSGFVDRYYFQSNYIRLVPNILFELATDGPGFIDDQEDYENLGETLTLPPHLRQHRDYVLTQLQDFDTVRSTKPFEKEYFDATGIKK